MSRSRNLVEAPVAIHQQLGALTVESVRTDTGNWWVWRDAAGKQVHAGLSGLQMVLGKFYELRDGRWFQVREP